jgi:predicted transcriptional regulator
MTKTAQRILDIAEKLDPERQRVLLEIAESFAKSERFFDTLSAADRADLDRSIVEADRGEAVTPAELNARLDAVLSSSRKQ